MSEFRRQHPLMIFQKALKTFYTALLPVLLPVLFATMQIGGLLIPILALTGLIIFTLLQGFLSWLFFSYRLEGHTLQIRSGIIYKQERTISRDRVQSINVFTNILQRPLRISQLQLKTAGSASEVEFTLHSVSWKEAERIQLSLSGERGLPTDPEAPVSQGFSIGRRELLIAGLSSGRFLILFSFLLVIYTQVMQYIPPNWIDAVVGTLESTPLRVIIGVAVALTLLSWLVSTLYFWVQYYGFNVRREGDMLQIRWGLLEERKASLALERVQALTVRESPPLQLIGRCSLRMELAGGSDRDVGEMKLLCPILPKRDVEAFLAEFLPGYTLPRAFNALPRRSRRRYMTRALVLPVILTIILALSSEYFFLGLLLIPPALLLGYVRHKDAGICVAEGQLCLRNRLYSRSTIMLSRSRIQSLELSAHPMQRMASLRHLSVAVLSSPAPERFKVKDVDKADCDAVWSWFSRRSEPQSGP